MPRKYIPKNPPGPLPNGKKRPGRPRKEDAPASPSSPTPGKKPYTPEELKGMIPDWRSTGATLAQARFAAEYLTNGFNAALAYRTQVNPGCKESSARCIAVAWMKDPKVQACLRKFTELWLAEKRDKLEQEIVKTLWAQAFYDPATFLDLDGSPRFKTWEEIPEDLRRVVEGIETKFYGKDASRSTTTLTLTKRQPALMALAQYIAMMKGGPAATSGGGALTPETELVLQAIFSKAPGTAPQGRANINEAAFRKAGVVG